MTGNIVAKQLSHDNQHLVLHKNQYISKLDQIIKDFERSNDYILPAQKSVIDNFVKAGGDPGIMPAIVGVKAIYLEAAFAEVNRVYGSMDRYFTEGLGIDLTKQKAIRDAFLEKK